MDFFRKTKGVISIFLIIIMLPLLTSAVILVDGTRYHSAKTMVQEAGDMAAYSTIANYNMNLKDEFGLFAIGDKNVSGTYKKYLTDTLGYSADKNGSYSKKVQDFISSTVFRGGSYKNAKFFNMYNFEVVNATVTPLHPLSDPAVLQNQIVEYVKYRGIETLLERFDILDKFDQIDAATKESQELMAAVETLSRIEESYLTDVSLDVHRLRENVEKYNANLSKLVDLMDDFYKCAADELTAFAVKDSEVSDKKQKRIDAYNAVIKMLDQLIEEANSISNEANNISVEAQIAIDKLNTFKSNHPNQADACETADQDIAILNALVEQKDTKYSLWNLKQNISAQQLTSLKSSLREKMDTLIKATQKTYNDYQQERTNAEDASTARYHFMLKSGLEWQATKDDNTDGSKKPEDFLNSALNAVEEYVGGITRNPNRIGAINIDSYKVGYRNKFEDAAKDLGDISEDKKVSVEDAVKSANSKKADSTKNTGYNTISKSEAALLPSKGSGAQKKDNKDVIPDVTKESASDALAGANSNAGKITTSFMETTRNDIYTYCYLLDNFKTRVTEKNINSNTVHSGIPDRNLVKWRYASSDGELDMRYRAKKNLDTFFKTNEVEYVFGGFRSENANATLVYSWIYGTRFVNNFAAVCNAYKIGKIRAEIDMLSAAASAATLWRIPASVFKWIFMTAWAAGETALDLALLIEDGYRIPLVKTGKNLFIQHLIDSIFAFSRESRLNYMRKQKSDTSLADKVNVCYEDYLVILLAFVNRETRLKRIGDLIQLNMRKRCDSGFTMSSAYTYVKADTTVRIKYMFQPVKQFSDAYIGTGLKFTNTIYQGY